VRNLVPGSDLVIVTCAIRAGIHAALAPEHFAEGTPAGIGFAVSAVVLAGLAVALTVRPGDPLVAAGAAATLAGLIVAYVFAVSTGLPVLHPDPEPLEGLALATKAIEVAGLAAALRLIAHPIPKGSLT
jgi:hypothetical protein